MEITDKCALSSILDEKPDFSTLLSYGNESVMLDKLIAETEKEMQAVKDAEQRKDLQDWTHLHTICEVHGRFSVPTSH